MQPRRPYFRLLGSQISVRFACHTWILNRVDHEFTGSDEHNLTLRLSSAEDSFDMSLQLSLAQSKLNQYEDFDFD